MAADKALLAHLAPERHRTLTILGHALLDVGQIGIEPARIGSTRGALGKALRMSVFAHCSAGETGRPADRQETLAGVVTPTHLLIGGKPAGPAVGARRDLGIAATVGAQALPRLPAITGWKGRKPSKTCMGPGKPALQSLAHVVEQMAAISDLQSHWRTTRGRPGVFGRAVACYDRNLRPAMQPRCNGDAGTVRQQIERTPTLQVDQERAASTPLAKPLRGLANIGIKPATTPILRRFGFRTVLIANTVRNVLAIGSFASVGPGTASPRIVVLLLFAGAARSMQFTALNTLVFADVPSYHTGSANVLFNVSFQLAIGMGIAVAAVALHAIASVLGASAGGHASIKAFRIVFLLAAALELAPLPGFLTLRDDAGAEVSGHVTRA